MSPFYHSISIHCIKGEWRMNWQDLQVLLTVCLINRLGIGAHHFLCSYARGLHFQFGIVWTHYWMQTLPVADETGYVFPHVWEGDRWSYSWMGRRWLSIRHWPRKSVYMKQYSSNSCTTSFSSHGHWWRTIYGTNAPSTTGYCRCRSYQEERSSGPFNPYVRCN